MDYGSRKENILTKELRIAPGQELLQKVTETLSH